MDASLLARPTDHRRRYAILLVLFTLLPTQVAVSAPAFSEEGETFSRKPELEVLVLTILGKELPGATLRLCRITETAAENPDGGGPEKSEPEDNDCRVGVADEDGEHSFTGVEPGEYLLTVELDGFVSTSIGPMSINAEDPIAPDRVVVVLNAACYHC